MLNNLVVIITVINIIVVNNILNFILIVPPYCLNSYGGVGEI